MKCPNCRYGKVIDPADSHLPPWEARQIRCEVCEGTALIPDPHSITFMPNGMTVVGDKLGNQIGYFQGRTAHTLARFKLAGINWQELPDVWGHP